MATTRKSRTVQVEFEAVAIEGALLSVEWLGKVAKTDAPDQKPADYRIPRGLSLRDEIARYWRIAEAHWADFEASRLASADAQAVAERFVLALLRDVFGFQSLQRVGVRRVGEREFPIGHAALEGRVPIVIAPAAFGLDAALPASGEGRRRTAAGLVQDTLNADESSLWGLASDGFRLRLLRDNQSLTRPASVEVDLLRIFSESRYADFALAWLLLHETRFGRADQSVDACPLEIWRQAGLAEGTRFRDDLRLGVEEALLAFGQGFWSHPDNRELRDAVQSGRLPLTSYFNELLRFVYRLIFVMAAEERAVLHPDSASPTARQLYADGYSLRRLRERAVRTAAYDRHHDAFEGQKIVFRALATGEPLLGLPALVGLFAPSQCPHLDSARLQNRHFLRGLFHLAWLREESGVVRVNWRDMGPEELGSVYESLLELRPVIREDGRTFGFFEGDAAKGSDRKKTGSYYTPDELVQVLLDQALEPVMADAARQNPRDPVEALLSLSIVDPACGSGHFLLAAARRLADRVARQRVQGTPSQSEYRHALRQVIGRCIYGVDKQPMAVELCRVALWMEAVEPGLPLSFLDAHIQCGDALLGTTPALMEKGIPDAAFEPLEGDDKPTARALKRRNKEQSGGQLFFDSAWHKLPTIGVTAVTDRMAKIESAGDGSALALAQKEAQWTELLASPEYLQQKFAADAWCAAFVWDKQPGPLVDAAPTTETWRAIVGGRSADELMRSEVEKLQRQYGFFHWHLQFPLVFQKGGFDVVLGNPPWERVKLQEIEFFASRHEGIATAPNAAVRKRQIAALQASRDPVDGRLWDEWMAASRGAEGQSHFVRASGRYPLCGKGDVNTYALFAEHNCSVVGGRGAVGCVLPAGIATDDTTKEFFQSLVERRSLLSIFHFENEDRLFQTVNNMFRYVLLAVGGADRVTSAAKVVAFARRAVDVGDKDRQYELSAEEIALVNPNTRTFPTFKTRRDAEINFAIYRRTGVLWRESDPDGNPWGIEFMAMLHMANDSDLFRTRPELEGAGWRLEGNHFVRDKQRMVPLIEAKMVHHFDHRYATYEGSTEANRNKGTLPQVTDAQHADPDFVVMPEYWVEQAVVEERLADRWRHGWLLGWRDICRSTDRRTVIASLIPRVAVGHTTPLLMPALSPGLVACLYANLCSFAFDYAARQKVGGTHLTYSFLKQMPVLPPATYEMQAPWSGDDLGDWLLTRIVELTFTARDLQELARDLQHSGPPLRWNPDRRLQLRCELDAAFFHLYGLPCDDVAHILDTFPVVQKNEERDFGEFRTKRMILEVYDSMANAMRTGRPFESTLPHPEAAQ